MFATCVGQVHCPGHLSGITWVAVSTVYKSKKSLIDLIDHFIYNSVLHFLTLSHLAEQ